MHTDAEASEARAVPLERDERASGTIASDLVIDIASAAAGEGDLENILFATLDRLQRAIRFTGGSIAIVDRDELEVRAAVGPFADEAIGTHLPKGPSRSWSVIVAREPFMTGDLLATELRVQTPRAAGAIRSWLAVPLIRHGEGIGLLEIDSIEPSAFDEHDLALMTTVARVLAGPVELALTRDAERRAGAIRDAFVGIISHELRTPITTIYGSSKILRRRGSLLTDEARDQLVGDIEAEADRLHRIVEDLLVLSRAERGRIELGAEPVLIAHVLRRAVAAAAGRNAGHRFESDLPPQLPPVRGDETYLEQVVGNLLSNAAKYSPSGSIVRVVAEADDSVVRVRVLDRGIGISADESARLFDLFYRSPNVTRTAEGAGIGLFVCRALVEAMGGRISASPGTDGGSEFLFELPIYPDDEPPSAPPS
ncbi:MAG TPA: ATP-binding protein [Candidatus Limnocylindrales bacterium]|nr:ATP-binding protein [Candidatus Limnocylindrales bacterium]